MSHIYIVCYGLLIKQIIVFPIPYNLQGLRKSGPLKRQGRNDLGLKWLRTESTWYRKPDKLPEVLLSCSFAARCFTPFRKRFATRYLSHQTKRSRPSPSLPHTPKNNTATNTHTHTHTHTHTNTHTHTHTQKTLQKWQTTDTDQNGTVVSKYSLNRKENVVAFLTLTLIEPPD